ncbi:hypothetical protein V8E52_009826 [Russula decolorans]
MLPCLASIVSPLSLFPMVPLFPVVSLRFITIWSTKLYMAHAYNSRRDAAMAAIMINCTLACSTLYYVSPLLIFFHG